MIEFARGLTPAQLSALAELERRVVAADGGRLKLGWGTLRTRSGGQVEDFLWWQDDRLVGFIGLYAHGAPTVEITGMVDPPYRRRRIATALLDAAIAVSGTHGFTRALLVTPRSSVAGRELAIARGATLDHSEHALALDGHPPDGPSDAQLEIRPATREDADELFGLLAAAFGGPPLNATEPDPRPGTLAVTIGGTFVGTLSVARDGAGADIYGFAVIPERRGRGIGRDVLRRICRQLRAEGVERIGLEVAVENEHALGLYTSLGFSPVAIEDYYALPAGLIEPLHG